MLCIPPNRAAFRSSGSSWRNGPEPLNAPALPPRSKSFPWTVRPSRYPRGKTMLVGNLGLVGADERDFVPPWIEGAQGREKIHVVGRRGDPEAQPHRSGDLRLGFEGRRGERYPIAERRILHLGRARWLLHVYFQAGGVQIVFRPPRTRERPLLFTTHGDAIRMPDRELDRGFPLPSIGLPFQEVVEEPPLQRNPAGEIEL